MDCNSTADYLLYYTLSGDATTDYPMCSTSTLSVGNTADYLLCSTLSGDTTTDYPVRSTLSAEIRSTLPVDITKPTIRCPEYLLCSVWRYSNRLSAVLFLVCRYYNQLSMYSTLSAITTTDYPLCSETTTASFQIETERLSAQLCLAILQSTICYASLLPH
jgi:hypothetical protein